MNNFNYTRELEKQVLEQQETIARLLSDIRSKNDAEDYLEKNIQHLSTERDAWRRKACDLQSEK
tara:strand:+ start:642 stop:833 length:192 start_codon:yes stop_codon:yes gene_type:complete